MLTQSTSAQQLSAPTHDGQVEDDLELLECMLADLEASPSIYQPTNYWSAYFEETVTYLRDVGLHDFRRSSGGNLPSFGATDHSFFDTALKTIAASKISVQDKERLFFFHEVAMNNTGAPMLPGGISVSDLEETAYRISALRGKECGAAPLENAQASLIGNPANRFDVDGRTYTHGFLYYYWRYAYCSQFIDFEEIDSIVEVGSGAGRQAELIKKLHPHIDFYLLDLAPQLYVCHQYLKALFPGEVQDYRTLRDRETVTADGSGQVLLLPTARVEDLQPRGRTLFWNAASFGEMEPAVVRNYLDAVKPYSDAAYLYQAMGGKPPGTPGKGGVIEPTRWEHYVEFLRDDFSLVDHQPAFIALKRFSQTGGFEDAFWRKSK